MKQQTDQGNRLHIGIFGKRNSGKSSLINAITNQEIAIVSDVQGTTTDPVSKAIEIHPLGPCVVIDTAGFDDTDKLGMLRVEKTKQVMDKIDVALMVLTPEDITNSNHLEHEREWINLLNKKNIPIVAVINKCDTVQELGQRLSVLKQEIKKQLQLEPIVVSATQKIGIDGIKVAISRVLPEDLHKNKIVAHLVNEGDVVMLVMPQDIAAPKGRLILPQVQTTRELLDSKCVVMSVTADKLKSALDSLKESPKLIITDSQVFKEVYALKPDKSLLTSFSVLFAGYKGDVQEFINGVQALDNLTEQDTVLIAEACTHSPTSEDIGRVKIPSLLRKKYGERLKIEIVNGADFPQDLSKYSLIIHCGACMFNRRHVLTRINSAKEQGIPISNYGVVLAKLTNILDKIVY